MKVKKLLIELANLLLRSDKSSADWVHVKSLRLCWYIELSFAVMGFIVGLSVNSSPLRKFLEHSVPGTFIYRLFILVLFICLIVNGFFFTAYYFRYVINKKKHFELSNVMGFYVLSTFFFGLAYYFLYSIKTEMFLYENPLEVFNKTLNPITWASIMMRIEFILFSAFKSVGVNYFRIECVSPWASIFTYFQTLYTIALVALLISSYVNQKTSDRNKPNASNRN